MNQFPSMSNPSMSNPSTPATILPHGHLNYRQNAVRAIMKGRVHGALRTSAFIKKYFPNFEAALAHESARQPGLDRSLYDTSSSLPWTKYLQTILGSNDDESGSKWQACCQAVLHPSIQGPGNGACICLTPSSITVDLSEQEGWTDIRCFGYVCGDHISYEAGLLALTVHAHKIFYCQPTRLFLHAVYINGTYMESWVFDRVGMYSGIGFDARQDPARLFAILGSYQTMLLKGMETGNEILTGSYVLTRLGDRSLLTIEEPKAEFELRTPPIMAHQALFGKGITVYPARDLSSNKWEYAVKFLWRRGEDRKEEDIFKAIGKEDIWGVVSFKGAWTYISTSRLRQGLELRPHTPSQAPTEQSGVVPEERVLMCFVTFPLGRNLDEFTTGGELVRVFRDAITGHRALYQQKSILHRDISPGNIIITDGSDGRSPHGMLIDLDLALNLAVESPKAGDMFGTRAFIAIDVLRTHAHTYRHDLESFFYVFLWTVIENRDTSLPADSKLRRWRGEDRKELARIKMADMEESRFESILDEFPPEFNPLKLVARSLRRLLFPTRDGVLMTGTDESLEGENKLYDGMINSFDHIAMIWPR
ncbi:FunK1 protein kinase [Xylariomycetidae sp. FL0641]|nr:FunK1 protein kinase [Xylariomycetidae sp. FL0641]